VDGADCPNCVRLQSPVQGLAFPLPSDANNASYHDPSSQRFVQLAEVYLTYSDRIAAGVPASNWNVPSALYFVCTILTTIGYGNFAPSTNASKVALTVLSIPGIAVFGVCLSVLSGCLLDVVTWLKDKIPFETTTTEHVAELDRLGEDLKAGRGTT
jgi:hypothetical protein